MYLCSILQRCLVFILSLVSLLVKHHFLLELNKSTYRLYAPVRGDYDKFIIELEVALRERMSRKDLIPIL